MSKYSLPNFVNLSNADRLPPIADRRPGRRKRTLLSGVVVQNKGDDFFVCSIRNCTDAGARITLPRDVSLSPYLFLIVVRSRIAHEAQVVWQARSEAGIRFIRTIALSDSMDLKLVYLNEIWRSHSPK